MKIRNRLAGLLGVAAIAAATITALPGVADADTGSGHINPHSNTPGGCLDVRTEDPLPGAGVQQMGCQFWPSGQEWTGHPFSVQLMPFTFEQVNLYQIRSGRGINMCLDVRDGSTAPGARIDVNTCAADGTDPNLVGRQLWLETRVPGNTAYYTLRPWNDVITAGRAAPKCLDVLNASDDDHTPLELWDCNGTWAQQFFGPALIGS